MDKNYLFIGVLAISIVSLLYSPARENIVFAATETSDELGQAEIIQIINKINSDDLPNVQILANSLENRLKDTASILEITGNLSEVRETPNASLLSSTLETLHGIPEDVDIEKRRVADDILSTSDIQVIVLLMPNGDVYLEEPFSRQQNLTKNNLSFRDYFRGAVETNGTYLGNIIESASSSLKEAIIAVPLYSPTNQSLVGVWAGGIDLSVLDKELQSLNLTGSNERVIYVDGNGTKIADSNKKLTNITESFSNLTSFQNSIDGKSGSVVELVNQTKLHISYIPVEALQNTWAVLWMRPIGNDSVENATVTTTDLNSVGKPVK